MRYWIFLIALMLTFDVSAQACTVLLHGLLRSSGAMESVEERLIAEGYHVVNQDYPSRDHAIDKLAQLAITPALQQCEQAGATPVHFVTHSLGGILVRQFASTHDIPDLGRVVMMGPPNQGSHVVDVYRNVPGFEWLNGPAVMQLGTDDGSIPRSLGPVTFDLGVIGGNRTVNVILSSFLPNPDDGKVAVSHMRVAGMCGFVVLPVSHALMMHDDTVLDEITAYLESGQFAQAEAERLNCPGRYQP